MERFRIGIVGVGFGVKSHLPALLAHPRFEVVALASPSSAARVAAERKIPHAFTSCKAMVEGCELDAVTVASPPFAHHRDVLDCLAARKHVLCEKPFALNVSDAEEMAKAAADAGTACGVAHEFRFVPEMHALGELVVNHHLDPLRNLEITLLRRTLHQQGTRSRGWWFERECGGGLAGAMLSHVIDQSNWLAGRAPERSTGLVRTANRIRSDELGEFESSVDDGAFAILDYGDGLVARLTADGTPSVDSYVCAVHGENRSAVASGKEMTELTLYSIDADETNELECKPPPYAKYASVSPHVPLLMELYDEFAKKIEGQPNALPTFEEAVVTQRVLAAIGFSATGSAR